MIFSKWTWRFYFIIGLLSWFTLLILMAAQIINNGCHSFNITTQIFFVLAIIFTGTSYAFMGGEK